jgi:hypothetical protein
MSMDMPRSVEDLTFILNTQNFAAGNCIEHKFRASAQVEAHFHNMPTSVVVPVCCTEGCTAEAFEKAREQAADQLAKNQLVVYRHRHCCGEGVAWRTSSGPGAEELPVK